MSRILTGDLSQAIRASLEEEKRRREREQKEPGEGGATQEAVMSEAAAVPDDDEEAMLAEAIALSMQAQAAQPSSETVRTYFLFGVFL